MQDGWISFFVLLLRHSPVWHDVFVHVSQCGTNANGDSRGGGDVMIRWMEKLHEMEKKQKVISAFKNNVVNISLKITWLIIH